MKEFVCYLDRWDERSLIDRLWDAISQLFNVFPFNGMCDETISSRCWRMRNSKSLKWKILRFGAEAIFWYWDRGEHCRKAHDQDLERWERRMKAVRMVNAVRAVVAKQKAES